MSAPSDIKKLQTSTRDFDAASCNGVNDHKSKFERFLSPIRKILSFPTNLKR